MTFSPGLKELLVTQEIVTHANLVRAVMSGEASPRMVGTHSLSGQGPFFSALRMPNLLPGRPCISSL